MLLKSIEIHGFKSFPDKTKLTFDKGITVVVGPNGSGKSNISDAVRWVLGEQSTKALRGEKMEDVIFSGTPFRKAQGFAEVSLTFDNTDRLLNIINDEVSVTRKYYRSGESEYKINGKGVRLKDVNELFMDTGLGRDGYYMVGQGRIAEIVSAKSKERRQIFEEAAGITKLRYRKHEAERRLEMAEENLIRLRDIISELESRIGPLKIQAEKAKSFIGFSEIKKKLEVSLFINNLSKYKQNIGELNDNIIIFKNDYNEVCYSLEQTEEKIAFEYEMVNKINVDIETLSKEKQEIDSKISDDKSKIAVCNNDIMHNNESIERLNGEIKVYSQNAADISGEIEDKKNKIDFTVNEVKELDSEYVNEKERLLKLKSQSDESFHRISELTGLLNSLVVKQSGMKINFDNIQNQIRELTENKEILNNSYKIKLDEISEAENELNELKDVIKNLDEKLKELKNIHDGYEIKLELKIKKLNETKSNFENLSIKVKEKQHEIKILKDLEQNMEGFSQSVKTVVSAGKRGILNGILGTVASVINVEKEYSVAVETALGGSLQNVITEDDKTAKNAIKMLKERNAGRATFLPLSSVNGKETGEDGFYEYEGFIGIACRLVKYDEKYKGVINFLLGRTIVAEDLNAAVNIAKKSGYRFKVVSLDGQVVNPGGSLTGGSQNRNMGILSRKNDIKSLENETAELLKKKEIRENETKEISAQVSKLQAQIKAVNSEIITLNEDRIRFEGEEKRYRHILNDGNVLISNIKNDIEKTTMRIEENKSTAKQLDESVLAAENEISGKQTELSEIKGIENNIKAEYENISNKLTSIKLLKAEKEKDIEALTMIMNEFVNNVKNSENAILNAKNEINELRIKNVTILKNIEKYTELITSYNEAIKNFISETEELRLKRFEREQKITEFRKNEKNYSVNKERLTIEIDRLEEKKLSFRKEYDAAVAGMLDEYNITVSEAEELAEPVENENNFRRELSSIKLKIRELGDVNLGAIDEYGEVSFRYEFLREQINDAEKSKKEIEKLINDLIIKMRKMFTECFEQVNINFNEIFRDLFGGGKASLELTAGEEGGDVLECGIEIFAERPGKLFKNLIQLSGGEQSFVAIAIYLAILKVRPAPFCVLDEIEAALDEVNVSKYARYIRLMSSNTQFIIITHRRGTMEEADVLYGAVHDKGLTKILKMEVSEASEKLINNA